MIFEKTKPQAKAVNTQWVLLIGMSGVQLPSNLHKLGFQMCEAFPLLPCMNRPMLTHQNQ